VLSVGIEGADEARTADKISEVTVEFDSFGRSNLNLQPIVRCLGPAAEARNTNKTSGHGLQDLVVDFFCREAQSIGPDPALHASLSLSAPHGLLDVLSFRAGVVYFRQDICHNL
jgi:hypothetical protein